MLPKLNFPSYTLRLRESAAGTLQVFDIVRKKFVDLSPEEWVRQHVIWFLVKDRNYPISLFTIERGLKVNSTSKRTDIVVFDTQKQALLLVECKAPEVEITQAVLEQSLRYNLTHKAPYVLLSNGIKHLTIDVANNCFIELPSYPINHHKTH